jgi:hypothetical protein
MYARLKKLEVIPTQMLDPITDCQAISGYRLRAASLGRL